MAGHEALGPIRFLPPQLSSSEAPITGQSDITLQLQQAIQTKDIPLRHARQNKACALLNALEAGKRKGLDTGIHLITSRPPEEESDNFTVYALFAGENGNPQFVHGSRKMLALFS